MGDSRAVSGTLGQLLPVVGGLQDAFSWLLQSLPELDIILALLHPDEWTHTHVYV